MGRIASIGEAAKTLGVSITTLPRWEATGKLMADHTAGGHRRCDLSKLRPEMFHAEDAADRQTSAYARVSSHDQKSDLERQKQVLKLFCARQGWTFKVVADLGSGRNYHKKGLKRLLRAISRAASDGWSSRTRTGCCASARNWCSARLGVSRS